MSLSFRVGLILALAALVIFLSGMHTLPRKIEVIPIRVPVNPSSGGVTTSSFIASESADYYVGMDCPRTERSLSNILMPIGAVESYNTALSPGPRTHNCRYRAMGT